MAIRPIISTGSVVNSAAPPKLSPVAWRNVPAQELVEGDVELGREIEQRLEREHDDVLVQGVDVLDTLAHRQRRARRRLRRARGVRPRGYVVALGACARGRRSGSTTREPIKPNWLPPSSHRADDGGARESIQPKPLALAGKRVSLINSKPIGFSRRASRQALAVASSDRRRSPRTDQGARQFPAPGQHLQDRSARSRSRKQHGAAADLARPAVHG